MTGNRPRTSRMELSAGAGGRWAFTLIELLTIIVILGLLISLTTPSILEAKRIFATEESRSRMHVVEAAVRMYSNDWEVLPPSGGNSYPGGLKGRQGLVQALRGYRDDDGCKGEGSRKVSRGPTFGPYLGPDQPMSGSPPSFIDAFGNPFYYFRYDTTAKAYQTGDNSLGDPMDTIPELNSRYLRPLQTGSTYYRMDYILITPGANRAWESFPSGRRKSDDIVNFDFQFKRESTK